MTIAAELNLFTTGDLVRRFAVPEILIRETLRQAGIGRRVGRYNVVADGDLPAVEAALIERGHLEPEGASTC